MAKTRLERSMSQRNYTRQNADDATESLFVFSSLLALLSRSICRLQTDSSFSTNLSSRRAASWEEGLELAVVVLNNIEYEEQMVAWDSGEEELEEE